MHYIPKKLLVITDSNVTYTYNDPIFCSCMQKAFQWANEMGLNGKKVSGLHIQTRDFEDMNPLSPHIIIWCQIECTEEERRAWEDMQRFNVEHAINNAFREE